MHASADQREPQRPKAVLEEPQRPPAGPQEPERSDTMPEESGRPDAVAEEAGPQEPEQSQAGPQEPEQSQAGPQEPEQVEAVLEALCAGALRLLGAAEQTPARLRLAAGGASVELEWPAPQAPQIPQAFQEPQVPGVLQASLAAVLAGTSGSGNQLPAGGSGSGNQLPAGTSGSVHQLAAGAAGAGTDPSGPAAPTGPGHQGRPAELCICAPMIGTFYHAPEPGSAAFVRPGDVVEAGQQVGILEVMKLMAPVEADRRCRVVEFLVPDAAPVEHGQPLISCLAE
jgi:acetyl-CoA carboxylase biotin carboxyl carrier protein